MSSRSYPKSRPWDRSSPGRRRSGGDNGTPPKDHYRRRDIGTPDRSKRGRWESPLKNRMESPGRTRRRSFDSPPRTGRRDVGSPRSRRRLDDGSYRTDGDYRVHQERHKEGKGPAGLVFLCNSSTVRDCFHYHVFGLPAAQRDIVERVVPGTKLFLFNFDTKELYGVFEASSRGGVNLVPEAFRDSKGSYAAQVRFTIFKECRPLTNEISKDVLKDNFINGTKFDCELSVHQVHKITELFSRTEIRPESGAVLNWDRDRLDQLGPERNLPFGANPLDYDTPHFPSAFQSRYFNDHSGFPDIRTLLTRPLPDNIPDSSVVLAKDAIEEVDQLALKYLRNDPGFAGLRLEPVNPNLLSTSLRNNGQLVFPDPMLEKNIPVLRNVLPHMFPGGVPASADPRLFGHPDMRNKDRAELPDCGKLMSDNVQRGLLPLPSLHHQVTLPSIPQHLGMQNQHYPPHAGVPLPAPFSASGAGLCPDFGPSLLPGVHPDLSGPGLPFHPLQGPHMIPPPQRMNHPQSCNHPTNNSQATGNRQHHYGKKSKKNKHKKNFQAQKTRPKEERTPDAQSGGAD